MATDPVEKAFLAELEALEKFRISYTGQYPNASLAREDPDVRRLIEAMAMFTARTRVAAERNVGESMLRLFRQHFPYLLSPVPAMTMLAAGVTARYVDAVEIPRGSEVLLVHRPEKDAPDKVFRFQTQNRLRISPDRPRERGHLSDEGPRVQAPLRFAAGFARNDEIGDVSLYVNHLNDLFSSLTVLYELKSHVRGASVVFDKTVAEDTPATPCQIRFGARRRHARRQPAPTTRSSARARSSTSRSRISSST